MKITMIAFLILLGFQGFSQEKFVEVTVSDTAWVKPDYFTYRITVNDDDDDEPIFDTLVYTDVAAYKLKRKQKLLQRNAMLDSVRQLIKKNRYHIISPNIDEVFLFNGEVEYKQNSIVIITGSLDSLRYLYKLVSGNRMLQANVESAFSKDETADRKYLYKKLLSQATKNATAIAELSGRKLGKLFSVVEDPNPKNDSPGGWTIYPPLSAINNVPGWHTTIEGRSNYDLTKDELATSYLIRNTLTVRFALD